MWISKWQAVSARILALVPAGEFLFKTQENDNFGITPVLLRNAKDIVASLRDLLSTNGALLPPPAAESLERFLREYDERFGPGKSAGGFPAVAGVLPLLTSFRAEFEYLLSDAELIARSLVVRALVHLQRGIVADAELAEKWKVAFTSGETSCERLGACHLLLHGIWAFKTSAAGERTDLVLGTQLGVDEDVQRAAEALVLTEWKRVQGPGEIEQKADEAHQQAKRYSEGILAGFELASRRYLILVSEDHINLPDPVQDSGITYEYRNVAVSPRPPSKH